MSQSNISVVLYESWMKQQIIDLTEKEYPFMQGWFNTRFEALYESSYQKNKNKIVVALENNTKVVACISYISWPVCYSETKLHAIQMVGLIVDSELRGRGLFKKILNELDKQLELEKPDVVLGFPVEISRKGFIDKGWNGLFNLNWFIKPVSITAVLFRKEFRNKIFNTNFQNIMSCDGYIQTASDNEFWNLRSNFTPLSETYYQSYKIQSQNIQIIFRIHKRAGMNVAVIGKIYSGTANASDIKAAIKKWLKDLKINGNVAMAATAVNIICESNTIKAIRQLFYKSNKSIYVIVKSYNNNKLVSKADQWNLQPADMETW